MNIRINTSFVPLDVTAVEQKTVQLGMGEDHYGQLTVDQLDLAIAVMQAMRNAIRLEISVESGLSICGQGSQAIIGTWDGDSMTILSILDPFIEAPIGMYDYFSDHYIGERRSLRPENVRKLEG